MKFTYCKSYEKVIVNILIFFTILHKKSKSSNFVTAMVQFSWSSYKCKDD